MGANVNEHKTRKMIFNHITTHPGVSFGIIKKVFELSDGTLRYHLNYLENRNEIKSSIIANNKCYYPVQSYIFDNRPKSEFRFHKLNKNQERLIDTVKRYPGINQKELIIRTGMKRITVSYNLNKLMDFGVIRKEPNGRNVYYYFITEFELKKKVMKKLMMKFLNYEIDEKTFIELKRKLEL